MLDEPTARAAAIIIGALGIPALLVSAGRSIWKWWTGRAGRERARNNDLVARLRDSDERADREALEKRRALEYASLLRRQLIEAGADPAPWPEGVGVVSRQERGRESASRRKKATESEG